MNVFWRHQRASHSRILAKAHGKSRSVVWVLVSGECLSSELSQWGAWSARLKGPTPRSQILGRTGALKYSGKVVGSITLNDHQIISPIWLALAAVVSACFRNFRTPSTWIPRCRSISVLFSSTPRMVYWWCWWTFVVPTWRTWHVSTLNGSCHLSDQAANASTPTCNQLREKRKRRHFGPSPQVRIKKSNDMFKNRFSLTCAGLVLGSNRAGRRGRCVLCVFELPLPRLQCDTG